MTDQDFQNTVIEKLAKIEVNTDTLDEDIKGIKLTLFGREGRTGVVNDLSKIQESQTRWNRGLLLAQTALTAALAYVGIGK